MKSVRIWSYSSPHFPALGLNTEIRSISSYSGQMQENTDQNNCECEHFLRSANHKICLDYARNMKYGTDI